MFAFTGSRRRLWPIAALLLLSATSFAAEAPRTWRDKTGRFEINAKLVKVTETTVRLLRADGREVDVPISALSPADQKFLADLASENPFEGGTPPATAKPAEPSATGGSNLDRMLAENVNSRELPVSDRVVFLDIKQPLPPLEADPSPVTAEFRQFARPLEKLDAYARHSPPVLVDPEGPVYAVSTHRVGNAVSADNFGRVYLAGASDPRAEAVIDIDQTLLLFDHHVPSGRSLAVLGVNSPSERGGDLVLLDRLATGEPTVVSRFHLPEWNKPGFKPKVEYARLLDAEHALVRVNDSVHLWNLVSGKATMHIERVSGLNGIDISGTGKYLAVATSGGCRIIDLKEGLLAGTIPFPTSLTPEPRFSPDGKRLALVAGNQFVVWDLATATVVGEATLGDPCGRFIGWIDNKYLLTQLAGLVDPDLGLTLWKYYLPGTIATESQAGGIVTVSKSGTSLLATLPVPHGPVAGAAEALAANDESLTLLRAGSEVALKVDAIDGVDTGEMLSGLQTAIERTGWRVNPAAEIQVVATIGRGEEQTLYFRTLGASIFGARQTATIKPYTAALKIMQGDQVIWSRSSTNMVPSFIRLERDETLQQAVSKHERADPSYFERLQIPPRLLRPEVSKNIGTSSIDEGTWRDR